MDSFRIPLIDSHTHLQDSSFATDLRDVLDCAETVGVRYLICNGSCEDDWPAVLELSRQFPAVVPCFGLHPWYVKERSGKWIGLLEGYLKRFPGGVGEIGIDRWIADRDESAQEEVFRAQLALARKYHRPVMIHCVRAWGWLMDVLAGEPEIPCGMLLHAYGGSSELIGPLADRGAYFSFSGTVLEPRRVHAREALAKVPRERLLIETDAPDMIPPVVFRRREARIIDGKIRNEPANLRPILSGIAELLGESEEPLSELLWTNGMKFFGNIIYGTCDK